MELFGQFSYWVIFFLMMTGFYVVIARGNLVAKIVGLNIFQTSVFLLYISMGKITGGTAPIVHGAIEHTGGSLKAVIYSNPLPHVLILTAIVVGVATTALGLALVVRIKDAYGTIEEDEIYAKDDPS
jgi:multicomponent Na+:H+ antiporter subunit C